MEEKIPFLCRFMKVTKKIIFSFDRILHGNYEENKKSFFIIQDLLEQIKKMYPFIYKITK